jgi:hypothetical protein
MRIKGKPVRSLAEVNYSDPSVVFWFFGQIPQKEKFNGVLKDKKTEKRTKNNKVSINFNFPLQSDTQEHLSSCLTANCSFTRLHDSISVNYYVRDSVFILCEHIFSQIVGILTPLCELAFNS